MGLDFALDELYATGWSTLDSSGCAHATDGRLIPGLGRILREFEGAGFELCLRKIDLFDCYRAEWRTPAGNAAGGVVGRDESEAAVYALAQMRRTLAHA